MPYLGTFHNRKKKTVVMCDDVCGKLCSGSFVLFMYTQLFEADLKQTWELDYRRSEGGGKVSLASKTAEICVSSHCSVEHEETINGHTGSSGSLCRSILFVFMASPLSANISAPQESWKMWKRMLGTGRIWIQPRVTFSPFTNIYSFLLQNSKQRYQICDLLRSKILVFTPAG